MSREESRQRLLQTNAICDEFEDAWQAGAQPSIEEFIPPNIDQKGEKQLIVELLELDQHLRQERGIPATYHSLIEKYPWVGDAVATLLGDSAVEGDASTLLSRAAKPQGLVTAQGLLTAREPSGADEERASNFLPGQLISERYRIVQLLGRGGMGDVYQADDIRLGQQVALKFLSSKLAESSELLQYLYDEVRLSQKLAHPHICRVHDLVVHQRLHFISMAYIEGETLHELLRRIGPLRFSKAIQLTQQICLGLSAAHQAGVLHRDLKPANIMVDNRGCAIIADFGLAREGPLENKDEGLVGTPIYMAPEQLSKNTTSVQSDIYALGLIMYEMFTGRRMYRGSLEELASIHDSSVALDSVQNSPEIPPAVAATISACLAREPSDRPRSAGSVLRMLPVEEGQEVALTTEETPSPGMLAATPDSLQISQGKSYALVGLICVLLAAATLLSSRTFARFGDLRARAYLAERSAEIVRAFQGENGRASYSAFVANRPALKWRLTGGEINRFHEHESAAYFWYRESPVGLAPLVPDWTGDAFLTVDEQRPTAHLPGSVHLRLDTIGNLRYLTAIPAEPPNGGEAATVPEQAPASRESELKSELVGPRLEFDGWELALGFVGLAEEDVARCKEVEPDFVPPSFADERRSYVFERGEEPGAEIQINLARSENSISYVHVLTPWTAEATHVAEGMAGSSVLALLRIVWIPLLVIAALWVARRNVFARRADRVGASRIAVCCALIFWIRWLLSGTHVSSALEMDLLFSALAGGCLLSGMLWCTYVAFEPIVRRYWPSTLVSWSRVIQGRIVDPLVGRDLLVGVAAGLLAALGKLLIIELPNLFGMDSYGLPNIYNFAPLGGLRLAIGEVLEAFNKALAYSLFFQLLFLVSLRLTLRNTYLATAVFVLFLATSVTVQYEPQSVAFVISAIEMLMTAVILMKFGVLPAATMHFVRLLMKFPVSVSPSIWYAEYGAIAIIVVIALTAFAFFCLQSGGSRSQSQFEQRSLFPNGAS